MREPYEALYNNFQWGLPECFNFVIDVVDQHVRDESCPALMWVAEDGRKERYTFADEKRLSC